MDILAKLNWRYATKKFDTKILPQEKIDRIVSAFNLTATSYGLQPVRLIVVKDKELKRKLRAHAMNQAQVEDASHLLVFCIEREVQGDYVHNYFDSVRNIRDTPEEVLAPFREMLADKFDKQHHNDTQHWAINQAYLAMGNLMTVCAVEGIDACPMEGFEPEKFDKELDLDTLGIASVLIMPIGYRANDDIFADMEKVRRPLEETVIYR